MVRCWFSSLPVCLFKYSRFPSFLFSFFSFFFPPEPVSPAYPFSPEPLKSRACGVSSIMPVIGNIYVIAGVSVIGGALFGFDISSISAILATNSYRCYFNQGPDGPPFNDKPTCSGPSSLRQGGITAAMPAGSWLGALVSGFLSDRLGRKYAIMIGCVFWLVDLPLLIFCGSC